MTDKDKRYIEQHAQIVMRLMSPDNNRQAFSLDELNDRLYDYIDTVTNAYIAHKHYIAEARKSTAKTVLSILAGAVVTAALITSIVLACMHTLDTITAVIICVGELAFVIFAMLKADEYNNERKNYKELADVHSLTAEELYVSVAIITRPLTHKEDEQC